MKSGLVESKNYIEGKNKKESRERSLESCVCSFCHFYPFSNERQHLSSSALNGSVHVYYLYTHLYIGVCGLM